GRGSSQGCAPAPCARRGAGTAWDGRRASARRRRPPESRPRIRGGESGSFAQQIQGFAVFDHAQLMAGTLLDRLHATLELGHLGIEDAVAFEQGFVLALLVGDLLAQFSVMGEAAVAFPQTVLQA